MRNFNPKLDKATKQSSAQSRMCRRISTVPVEAADEDVELIAQTIGLLE